MIRALQALRELVLGETWVVPLGVAAALVVSLGLKLTLREGLWQHAGGFVLLGLVLGVLALALQRG